MKDDPIKEVISKIEFDSDKRSYKKHVITNMVMPMLFYVVLGILAIKWLIPSLIGIGLLTGFFIGRYVFSKKS
jgi:hypothetical protein